MFAYGSDAMPNREDPGQHEIQKNPYRTPLVSCTQNQVICAGLREEFLSNPAFFIGTLTVESANHS